MKLIKLLFIVTLLFTVSANAQITKGNWMVGGSGNFTNYKSTYQNNNVEITQTGNGLQISPNIGYFVRDKFAVGTSANFGFSNPSGDNNNSHGYGVSPFVRYYFLKPEKMVNLFAQASYGFSEGKSDSGGSNKSSGYSFKMGPAIFFNNSTALEFTLDYNGSKYSDNSKSNYFTVGIGFQIHLEKR